MNEPKKYNNLPTLFDAPASMRRDMTLMEARSLDALKSEKPLIMSAQETADMFIREKAEIGIGGKALLWRLVHTASDLQFDVRALSFLLLMCKNFGDVTLWVYSIVRKTREANTTLTIEDMCRLFEDGKLPTEEFYEFVWDEQKGHFSDEELLSENMPKDNFLDTKQAYVLVN